MSRLFIWTQEEIEVTRCIPLFWTRAQKSCLTAQLFGGQDDGSPFSRASELESSPLCAYWLTPTLLLQQPGADRLNANPIWSFVNTSAVNTNSGGAANLNKAFRTMTLMSRDYEARNDVCFPRFEEQYLTAEQRSVNTSTLRQHCLLLFE